MSVLIFLGGFLLVAIGGQAIGFTYFLNLWYGGDCFLNAVLAGDPRETISSRWGKAINRGNRLAILAARYLFLTGHFYDAINEDVGQRRVPVAMVAVGVIFVTVFALAWFSRA